MSLRYSNYLPQLQAICLHPGVRHSGNTLWMQEINQCAKKKVLLHFQFLPKPTRGEYLISLLCTHYFVEVVSAPRALFPFPAANAKAPTSSFSAPKAVPFKGLHVARSVPPLFAHYVVIYHPLPSDRISCVCTTASRHRPIVLRDA